MNYENFILNNFIFNLFNYAKMKHKLSKSSGVKLVRLGYTLMVHVHCTAHRLALAVSQAAKEVDRVKKYEETVHQIFTYFHNSPVRLVAQFYK